MTSITSILKADTLYWQHEMVPDQANRADISRP
jgi:hypothetical protein